MNVSMLYFGLGIGDRIEAGFEFLTLSESLSVAGLLLANSSVPRQGLGDILLYPITIFQHLPQIKHSADMTLLRPFQKLDLRINKVGNRIDVLTVGPINKNILNIMAKTVKGYS
jgi:hypothetical protein